MIYALLGTLSYAIANTLIRYVSLRFDLYKSMFFQYVFVSFFGFLLVTFFDGYRFDLLGHMPLFLLIAVAGFLGIWGLMMGMQHLSGGVNFIVANTYVVVGYFVNNYIFPGLESFTAAKLMTAFAFFLIISIFLFEKDEDKGIRFNKKIYFPLLAALGWTIYTSAANFAIKSQILTPFQGMFYCELSITMIVVLVFIGNSIYNKRFDLKISLHQMMANCLISFFIFAGALGFFIGYGKIPGNYVNIIGLAQIPALSILSYIFLKDKMTKTQTITLIGALAVLSLFLII